MSGGGGDSLRTREVDDALIIYFMTDAIVSMTDIERIGTRVFGLVESIPKPKVILDMCAVKHVSSSFISKLISLNRLLTTAERKLAITGAVPDIRKLAKMLRLDKIIPFYDNDITARVRM